MRGAPGGSPCKRVSPAGVLPLRHVLAGLPEIAPRAARYLDSSARQETLRVVYNGMLVEQEEDPWVREGDGLLILIAIAGGA